MRRGLPSRRPNIRKNGENRKTAVRDLFLLLWTITFFNLMTLPRQAAEVCGIPEGSFHEKTRKNESAEKENKSIILKSVLFHKR